MLFIGVALAAVVIVGQALPTPAPPPRRTDPCGGSQELLKKYLAASPCVFVIGQGSVQMTYAGTNTPANGVASSGGSSIPVSGYRHAFGYPGTLVNLGITRNSQLTFALPSFSQLTSARLGTLAAGTTDVQLSYKNLSYVDSVNGILAGILLNYEAPTGSPGLAAPGPAYAFNPLLNIALNKAKNIGVSLAFPVTNSVSGTQRGWSFAPQAVPYWRSPGGTLLALVVRHDFTANQTSLTINSAQLITRQFQVQGTYGGTNPSIDYASPVEGLARVTGTAYPRSFTIGFSFMMGISEIPSK